MTPHAPRLLGTAACLLTGILALLSPWGWLAATLGAVIALAALYAAYYQYKNLLSNLTKLSEQLTSSSLNDTASGSMIAPLESATSSRAILAHLSGGLAALEVQQQEAEERYKRFAAGSNDGLWEWHVDSKSVAYSPRWCDILGLNSEGLAGTLDDWFDRIHPEDSERVHTHLQHHLVGESDLFEVEHRVLHADGSYRWALSRGVAVRSSNGRARYITGSLSDLTQRGLFDALTSLPNRNLLKDRTVQAINRAGRAEGRRSALLYMDLNDFKTINDSLGHHIGDLLLAELAKRLQLCVRSGDTVARLGGDEFVVLVEGLESDAHLKQIISRIERYTTSSFDIKGHYIVSSVSIGIVPDLARYSDVDEVLRDADIAMYHAKGKGRSYTYFDESMHTRVLERQQLEIELRQGLERGELFLLYQPIVSLVTGDVEGFEALVRWQHPTRGLVSPNDFIPMAEETGLIMPLGEWVLREACFQMDDWKNSNGKEVYVSVNLSGRQLSQPDIVERVKRVLAESGFSPSRLKLEITETAVIEDPERVAGILHDLKALGVFICMDDFGTGYSSLNYIHQLPIDVLKIDQSFIRQMINDPRSLAIVRTVTEMAKHLGIDVIPEGIEDIEQMSMLQGLNCELGQGYLFSKPVKLETAKGNHTLFS